MSYWKCTVCGYIHEGEGPPEKCPVCGASSDKFERLPGEEGKKAKDEYDARMAGAKAKARAKKEEAKAQEKSETPSPPLGALGELMHKNKAHPIAVHFPNGLIPVIVFFLLGSVVLNLANLSLAFLGASSSALSLAAFFNLGVVALSMPLVLLSGWIDWRIKFKGYMTKVFKTKIIMGIVVTGLSWLLVVWRLIDPLVADAGGVRYVYVIIHLAMLGAAAYAGHLGGKLVFRD